MTEKAGQALAAKSPIIIPNPVMLNAERRIDPHAVIQSVAGKADLGRTKCQFQARTTTIQYTLQI